MTKPKVIDEYNNADRYAIFNQEHAEYNRYIANKNIESTPYSVKELNNVVNNNYLFLIIWFIITIFVILITIVTLLDETSMNKYGLYLIILFIFYIFFYFLNNIFKII
jgi:hypothetical protein